MIRSGIGTLKERSLHAALKAWYAQPGDRFEVDVDGYVIDIVRGELLIEIQTSNFATLKRKLHDLTRLQQVRLVYPIAVDKWIVKRGADGKTPLGRRKSPQRGNIYHLFRELVRFPKLVMLDTFSIEAALVRIEQIRVNDGQGSWRRGGWRITDHKLLEIAGQVVLESPDDFRNLLPNGLTDPFTTHDLANALGERISLAQKMAYCLREMGAVEHIGKRGNAYLYSTH